MSYTNGYQADTTETEERKPPTIADIVREKTDGGARIIDFFLDLMEGRVADARLCHRIDAAKQLVKYGHKGAADYIAEHRDEPCDHCESRKRGPRSRNDASPAAAPLHAQDPANQDFLSLLTEDFLTVLSGVDEDLMIMLVRAQTRDGGTVIAFLDDVMQNRVDGFRPNHRIAAAKELISHILRDEQHTAVVPAEAGTHPVTARTAIVPEKCLRPEQLGVGTHPVAARTTLVPAQNGTHPVRPEPVEGQCSAETTGPVEGQRSGNPANTEHTTPVVPAQAGTQGGGGARTDAANTDHPVHTETALSTVGGPQLETNNSKPETSPTPGRSPPW